MPGVEIHRDSKIHRTIIDTGCVIPKGSEIGLNREADEANGFRVTDNGITLVTPDALGQNLHQVR